jgi:hypothetical protein
MIHPKYNLLQVVSALAILPLLASLPLPAIAEADRSAIVSELKMDILTGGDDLRGGSVAYAEIRLPNGTVLPKVNLNDGAAWGGNSNNSPTLPLPAGTRLGSLEGATVTISHDGAPRNVFDGYDNWNVDRVNVTTPTICSNSTTIARGLGRPWVRFDGGRTFKKLDFNVPAFARNLTSPTLAMDMVTGGDDLRDGSVAYGEIRLRSGRVLPKVNLNGGASWGGNSSNSVSLPLPAGTKLSSLASITLSHDGAPRRFPDGYDNWNLERVFVNTPKVCNNGVSLASVSGGPWVRFTGGLTFKEFTSHVN